MVSLSCCNPFGIDSDEYLLAMKIENQKLKKMYGSRVPDLPQFKMPTLNASDQEISLVMKYNNEEIRKYNARMEPVKKLEQTRAISEFCTLC